MLLSVDASASEDVRRDASSRPVLTDIPKLRTAVARHRRPGEGPGIVEPQDRIRRLAADGARVVLDVPPLADDELAVDLAVFAKGIANGMPLSALVGRADVPVVVDS